MILTHREYQTLEFVKKFIDEKGYSPTIRQVMKGLKMKSSASPFVYLHRLQDKGALKLGGRGQLIVEVKG